MYEVRLHNHCCRVKATTITYSRYTSVALIIQHAQCIRHITFCHLWPILGLAIFFHIISYRAQFSRKLFEQEMRVSFFFSNTISKSLILRRIQLGKGKGKAIPLQPLTGPEGSSRVRLPDIKTIGT
jgi:hypothetical protein